MKGFFFPFGQFSISKSSKNPVGFVPHVCSAVSGGGVEAAKRIAFFNVPSHSLGHLILPIGVFFPILSAFEVKAKDFICLFVFIGGVLTLSRFAGAANHVSSCFVARQRREMDLTRSGCFFKGKPKWLV